MAQEERPTLEDMPFHSRELSWLDFADRVLGQAGRESHPLLERLNYLCITRENLDEFFMVRVAGLLRRQGGTAPPVGLPPERELTLVLERVADLYDRHAAALETVLAELGEAGIRLAGPDLTGEQSRFVRGFFFDQVLPVLTPMAVDRARPMPRLPNRARFIAVRLDDGGEDRFGLVTVPPILPHLVLLPCDGGQLYMPLEDIIIRFLDQLFGPWPIRAWGTFRLTRSTDFDPDEDTEDLRREMERTLEKRKRGAPVRLELGRETGDETLVNFFLSALKVEKRLVFRLSEPIEMQGFREIGQKRENARFLYPPVTGSWPADLRGEADLLAAVRRRDRLVHFPYESFGAVEQFLQTLAEDDRVLAIKQTLYRVSDDSQIVAALERAASLGKSVTVLVELKARFDEEKNLRWAARLEEAGCHVIYGVTGLKTHCKLTMAVRREEAGLRRYLYLATGNYNDRTARKYTDLGLFTCDREMGEDVAALFNRLTGYTGHQRYGKLVVSPESMRGFFLDALERERENYRAGRPAGVYIKVNSLLDSEIIAALYRLGRERVPVRLLVRGICGLVPGVEGFSESIQVRSVVGRFLEHSRVFVFENGGEPLIYVGSTDLMPRNLDRRVEAIFPVEDEKNRKRILAELELIWRDNVGGLEMAPDGGYRRIPGGPVDAQAALWEAAAGGKSPPLDEGGRFELR